MAEIIIIGGAAVSLLLIGVFTLWAISQRNSRPQPKAVELDLSEGQLGELQKELHDKAREDLARAIEENTAFIQKDVRRTTSQLNGYMQQEVTRALDEEITRFAKSTDELERVAASSITRMQSLLNERYLQLSARVDEESAKEKDRIVASFEENMSGVVGFYVSKAIGGYLDVDAQLDYIIKELEANKQAIIEDIRNA